MRSFHRQNRLLDVLTFVALWSVIGTLFYQLGTRPFGLIWLGLFVLQGFALQCLGFCAHDLFVHRRVGGERLARVLANVCLIPLMLPAGEYAASHFQHHWYLGSARDGESYKEDLDRRWVKWIYLIGPGTLAVAYRVFRRKDAGPLVAPERSAEVTAQIRWETLIILVFMALVGVAILFWPRLVLAGYILPSILSLPFASAVRVILEHGEMSFENPFHAATCYTPNPLFGALFLWGVGDAHLIHHLFPNIPYYRVGAARAAILPILLRQGVIRRTSLLWLLGQWFVRNRRHATIWS
jgi:fatty acid desaturase